jgi:hypothetical protein
LADVAAATGAGIKERSRTALTIAAATGIRLKVNDSMRRSWSPSDVLGKGFRSLTQGRSQDNAFSADNS